MLLEWGQFIKLSCKNFLNTHIYAWLCVLHYLVKCPLECNLLVVAANTSHAGFKIQNTPKQTFLHSSQSKTLTLFQSIET
jgi:hypothetical protein